MHITQKGVKRLLTLLATVAVFTFAAVTLASCDSVGGISGGTGSNVEGPPRDNTPVVLQVSQPGVSVYAVDDAVMDYSNAAEGYICVMSNLPGIIIKVLVDTMGGTRYQYTISSPGEYITIPLSEGDGVYAVGVWRNVFDDQYSAVFSQNIEVILTDEYTPFLYPSQFVNFAAGDASTNLSQELTADNTVTDVDAINHIYRWVCENIDYDMEKATTVASGYLPNNNNTLTTLDGICFDYAVLTASMLRAQRVPAKLVIGYAGQAYHAWIEVRSFETGGVMHYKFDGTEWVRMDPTFDAAASGAIDLSGVIGDGTNYQPLLQY